MYMTTWMILLVFVYGLYLRLMSLRYNPSYTHISLFLYYLFDVMKTSFLLASCLKVGRRVGFFMYALVVNEVNFMT